MKNILYFCLTFFILSLMSYFIYYIPTSREIKNLTYFETSLMAKSMLNDEITLKRDRLRTIGYLINQDKNLAKALITKDKSILGHYHSTLEGIKNYSKYKNMELHIFDKNGNSFYRSWSNISGDNMTKMRPDIARMTKDHTITNTMNVGRFDLNIGILFPIFDDKNEFIGMMELTSKINSIANILQNNNIYMLAVINERYTKEFIQPFTNLFIGQNYIANLNASEEIMDKVGKKGLNNFSAIKDYMLFDQFMVTSYNVNNLNDDNMVNFLLFIKKDNIHMSGVHKLTINYSTLIIIFMTISGLIFLYIVDKSYIKKLNTEIKNQTERLLEKRHKIDKIYNIYDKYISFSKTDLQGIITYVSKAFTKLTGYSQEELIGKPHNIVRHPDMTKKFFKNMWEQLTKQQEFTTRLKNRKKDGTFYWIEANLGPDLDRNGEHIGYFSVGRDITANKELEELQQEIITLMCSIAESKNKETTEHLGRVSEYCEVIAKGYGLSKKKINMLKLASEMHDIGKISIPDDILTKPSSLTHKEFEIIKTHSTAGYNLLKISKKPLLKMAATIAYTHHEKYDGTGYPRGLKGEEIPLYGRIVALVDTFDALSNDRCYKKAWDMDDVLTYIKEQRGKHFDPKLVDIFFRHIDEILDIKKLMNYLQ